MHKKPNKYGEHKIRTMARSILPSNRAKSSREDKRIIHKRERSKVRYALHDIWDLESAEECDRDYWHTEDVAINYNVYDRRSADKTNHFVRWAKAVTADIEDEQEKYAYIQSLMPDTLPGRHSLTHLPWDKHYDPNAYRWRLGLYTPEEIHEERVNRYLAVHKALYDVCASAQLTEFNNFIRNRWVGGHRRGHRVDQYKWEYHYVPCEICATPRLLKGSHDIDDWLCFGFGEHRDIPTMVIEWLKKNEYLKN